MVRHRLDPYGSRGRVRKRAGSWASIRFAIHDASLSSSAAELGLKRGSVRRKSRNSAKLPSNPTSAITASISARMRPTSRRPIWWIFSGGVPSVVVVADPVGVVSTAVGELRGPHRLACPGDVLGGHEFEEPSVGGHDLVTNRLLAGSAEPLALGLGHALREGAERCLEDALGGILDKVGRNRLLDALEDHPRQGHAALEAEMHGRDLLVRP